MLSFLLYGILGFQELKLSLLEPNQASIEQVYTAELQSSPYVKMKGVPSTFTTLFGEYQAATILKKYNPDLALSETGNFNEIESFRFPMIYPELEEYFPHTARELSTRLDLTQSEKNVLKSQYLLVIAHTDLERTALGFYYDGKLTLATFISIGKKNMRSKEGIFSLRHDSIFYRSRMFNGEPMPYALRYSGPYFLHRGESDGTYRSHGCVRVPGIYQKRLYEHLPSSWADLRIIVHKPYEITLFKK